MKKAIREIITGRRGELSSKRVIAFLSFFVAVYGFIFKIQGFEQFLYFCSIMIGGTLFERK